MSLQLANQDDSRFVKYVEKDCDVVSIREPNPSSNKTISTTTLSQGGQSLTTTINRNLPGTLDQVNQEIYNKLLKAGNKKDDAKFAATGVKTMPEAMERLKTLNKKK